MGKNFFKIVLIGLVSFIFILVVTPYFFRSKIAELIKREANKNLNATFSFDNNIGLNLFKNFPNLSIAISNLSIVGKGEFEADTLIYIKETKVVVDLKTLWDTKEIPIRRCYAEEPYINIIYHKNGKANYDITMPDSLADTSSSKVKIKLDVYELKNGRINYDDQGLGFYAFLNGVDHLGSGNFDAMVFDLKTKTNIKDLTMSYGGVKYLDHVKTYADAVLLMDLNKYRFEFKNNMIALNDLALNVNGFVALPNDQDIVMDLTIKNNQIEFKKLLSLLPSLYKNKFEELQASGNFTFEGILKGTYNSTTMPGYGLHLEVKEGALKYPALPEKISDISMILHVANNDGITDHTVIDLQQLHAAVAHDEIDARVKVTNLESNAFIDAVIKGKLNLATLTQIVPMAETKISGVVEVDVKAKGNLTQLKGGDYEKLNASGNFSASNILYESNGSLPVRVERAIAQLSPTKIVLSEFRAMLNKSDLEANGSFENFFGYMLRHEKVKGTLSLHSSFFNCNELISKEGNAASSDTAKIKPFKIPENIDFVLNSKINKLKYDLYDISNFIGNVKINNGILSLENTSLELLEGKFVVNGSYNSLDIKKPVFDFTLAIQQLDIQKAFKAFVSVKTFAPLAQYMSGMLNTSLHYSSTLDENFMPLLSTINSKGSLDILRAAISGCKPLDMLADNLQLSNLKRFDLQRILLAFMVSDGQLMVKPFKTKWNSYTMELLEGATSLDKSMNFHLKLSVPRAEFGPANSALNTMVAQLNAKSPAPIKLGEMVDVDVFLSGNMMNPEIRTSLRNSANKALDDMKDALIKKAQDSLNNLKLLGEMKVKEEALKVVADAQKQADKIKSDAAAYASSVKQQGYRAADSLVNSVQNPVAKIAARAASERLKKEADAKAQKIMNEANSQADAVVTDAKQKAGLN